MPYQNISATLNETDVQEIKAALATIEQKLPFLITLTAEFLYSPMRDDFSYKMRKLISGRVVG